MAKGNLFLGMGRGSIGDVTFYRGNGQQQSRVRNRNPRNPRSQAQLYQRAIMATVVKAYQAGKAIFDHSFQGYSVGEGCQRQFLSLNAKMLRELVANDMNGGFGFEEQLGRVVPPSAAYPTPDPFIISRGTYNQSLWTWDPQNNKFELPAINTTTRPTVADYAEGHNLIPGDIYTFVVFACQRREAYVSPNVEDYLANQKYCQFAWVRMIVKEGLENDDSELQEFEQLFEFEASGGDAAAGINELATADPSGGVQIFQIVGTRVEYTNTGAIGVIRSRRDMDLRSESKMQMVYGSTDSLMFGIASGYLLQEWSGGSVQIGNSELILEGGDA